MLVGLLLVALLTQRSRTVVGLDPSGLLGSAYPALFEVVVTIYLGAVISSGIFFFTRTLSVTTQVSFALYSDVFALTLLMHASGGTTSGLGLLISVSIAAASLLMDGRQALFFAALASLAVLASTGVAHWRGFPSPVEYAQSAFLGIAFFAVALVALILSRRLRATEQLARQRGLDLANMAQLNAYIIEHMNTGVLAVDQDLTIRLMNETAWYLLGMPGAKVGEPLERACNLLPDMIRDWRKDTRGTAPLFRPQLGGAELKPAFAPLGVESGGILIFLEDSAGVTQQAQQLKLASLGRLTASIAHEIRNPLGAISHAGQLLAESPDLNGADQRLTEIIKANSKRVNTIIETVLQLSRREQARPEYLNLGNWIKEFQDDFVRTRMLDPELFRCYMERANLWIYLDPAHLTQVLTNLCDNALVHGASEQGPASVQLNVGLAKSRPHPFVEVLDQGAGIDPSQVRQIFEPFFTTRAKGTGLGLYIARELCEINQVDLEYLPVPTGGSCFRLNFHRWKRAT